MASEQPDGVGPQADGKSDEVKDSKAPQWGRLLIGLLIALVLATIMATTYISANHGVVAHNVPWGVTGSSSLTTDVQKNVSLDIHQYANQADLENAANNAEIYGGFVPQTNTLIINVAASLWAPFVMPQAYLEAARQEGVKLQAKPINTLPPEDPEGVVPGLALFVLLVAGYLGSTFAMQRTKTAAAHRRVTVLLGYSIVVGLVVDLIAGPILRAYPDVGSNFWKLWPEFALICFAVALLAATLQSLIGPLGTLVTVVIVVFFGNPSTGGGNGVAYLPPFWQDIGVVLPPRNGLYLVRNTLYFHGNSITLPLIVLGIYVVVCAALVIFFSWGNVLWWRADKRKGGKKPRETITPAEETGTAATPPG
ncbi:hypothetical protein [Amycolatopsis sp. NPDC050768]|uniref:hypothetical protein n=1 Tax=Amycolatopsis sp. NPDC050768 TaxID=3154839 RepID=UPI0033D07954